MPFRETVLPILSSRTLSWVGFYALLVSVYSALPVWLENSKYADWSNPPSDLHAALSLVLGWLLVFRTNTAYSRWWEARTLWGSLVNASRNMAIKLCAFGRADRVATQPLIQLVSEFPKALMDHLRAAGAPQPATDPTTSNPTASDLTASNPSDSDERSDKPSVQHGPMRIAQELVEHVSRWHREGLIDGDEFRAIDLETARLMDICGACERIAKTPLIRSYKVFARQCITLFLATLPWGIAHDFGWWTIPLTLIVSYFMIGLETVAEHVEEPFGLDEDDLDLENLCRTIERSVGEVFSKATGR